MIAPKTDEKAAILAANSTAPDRGESVSCMEPMRISKRARDRAALADLDAAISVRKA